MTAEVQKRAAAFIRSVAGECSTCLRRAPYNCDRCYCRTANAILREIDACGHDDDASLLGRTRRVLEILGGSDRPLLASEIDLGPRVSAQLKNWTLNRMVSHGAISRRTVLTSGERVMFLYSTNERMHNHEDHSA